jgi:hypothetical protein
LSIDPFASKPSEEKDQDGSKTPKTPTAMFKRTMSLVRKRSRSVLTSSPAPTQSRDAYTLASPSVQTLPTVPYVADEEEVETPTTATSTPAQTPIEEPLTPATPVSATPFSPITYHEILKTAKKNARAPAAAAAAAPATPELQPRAAMSPVPQSPTPASPASQSRRVFSFHMGRRRSLKAAV